MSIVQDVTAITIQGGGFSDQASGLLLGIVAGDRVGGPSQLALTLAESMIQARLFDLDRIGQDYLAWWEKDGFDAGLTAHQVFSLVQGGASFKAASFAVHVRRNGYTGGCNPLHRNTPLALHPGIPDDQLELAAQAEAELTHLHPAAGESAAKACLLCRNMLNGLTWEAAVQDVLRKRSGPVFKAVQKALEGQLETDGFAPHALGAAIYFVQNAQSFDEALSSSLDFAGDGGYSPVTVGALAGCRWGAEDISDSWLDEGLADRAKSIAHRLESQRGLWEKDGGLWWVQHEKSDGQCQYSHLQKKALEFREAKLPLDDKYSIWRLAAGRSLRERVRGALRVKAGKAGPG